MCLWFYTFYPPQHVRSAHSGGVNEFYYLFILFTYLFITFSFQAITELLFGDLLCFISITDCIKHIFKYVMFHEGVYN